MQRLYRGPAAIIQDTRRANVRCRVELDSDPDGQHVRWNGYFWDADLPVGKGEAMLIVPGALSAAVTVTDIWPGSGSFTGSGPPPAPRDPVGEHRSRTAAS